MNMLVNLEVLLMTTVQRVNASCHCTGMHGAKSERTAWKGQGKVRAQSVEDN